VLQRKMQLTEAITLLGLNGTQCPDEATIKRAWKQRARCDHPDKNTQDYTRSNQRMQRLNHAKDMLLENLANEAEALCRQAEAKRKEEEAEAEERRRRSDAKTKELDELYERTQKMHADARRERYSRNRKKRAAGTRVHRKTGSHQDGMALIEELNKFFQTKLVSKPDHRILVCDILDLFSSSRGGATELDKNMFRRHNRKLISTIFPEAIPSTRNFKRCFWHIGFNKTA
jgi:curved DNA-binding protein CbpA